jgi:2'-5' RNA ligase
VGALTDNESLDFTVVPDDELVGYTEDEAYAFLAGIGPETSTAKLPPLVAAADGESTGAMIALVPSDADAKRLAVDGGEPPGELHLTLVYLGEADEISDDARAAIEAAVRRYARGPITAEAFSVNMFNPNSDDRDMAVVLGVGNDGGPALRRLHADVSSAVRGVGGFELPEQHEPWVPHVTLAYTDDVNLAATVVDRVGPITFDKLRLAFADQVIDVALGAENLQLGASVSDAGGR